MSIPDFFQNDHLAFLDSVIKQARKAGAEAADAVLFDTRRVTVVQRLGQLDHLEHSESCDLGLRVFIGHGQAIVSSTDLQPKACTALIERAIEMVHAVPQDPYCGLADADQITHHWPTLDLYDPQEPTIEQLRTRVQETEEAALAVKGITQSEGAEASWGYTTLSMVSSNGFTGHYTRSGHHLSVSVIAGKGTAMERDYAFSSAVYGSDLRPAVEIGKEAGERTVQRLNPRKVPTQKVPILYDPRVACRLLSNLSGAIKGSAIAYGTSFLKDFMDKAVFAQGIDILDDPFVARGLRSRPFDGEGIHPQPRTVISNGHLTTWFLDLRAARHLGLTSTGHATRGTSSPPSPSPSNLTLSCGNQTPEQLIRDVQQGLYVTELIGHGVNTLTGDYSLGATGLWIDNGCLTYPVSEITIAGNLKEMFRTLEPANDLKRQYGIDSPTVRIDSMTVAGT